jgi:hypothetical protein
MFGEVCVASLSVFSMVFFVSFVFVFCLMSNVACVSRFNIVDGSFEFI